MAALKNLAHMQKVFAYVCLITSIMTFSKLTKSSELIVARASGLSVWQFIMPALVSILLIGCLNVVALNPLMTALLRKYEKMEAQHLKGQASLMTLSPTGLWVIQHDPKTKERSILHALRVSQDTKELHDITIYFLTEKGNFKRRVDAESAILKKDKWLIRDSITSLAGHQEIKKDILEIPTNISFERIEESMIPPQTISFWNLSTFISMAESSGLSAVRHKMYFYSILISPLFFVSLVLLGSYFALTSIREHNFQRNMVFGLITGFLVYFFSDLIFAFGLSRKILPLLAAFMPAVTCLLVGMLLMLQREE